VHETISPSDVYDKDLNFLFGSGASFGLFPTLALKMKDEHGRDLTLEALATRFESENDQRYIPLFMYYYNACIRPAQVFSVGATAGVEESEKVVANYRMFLNNVLQILSHRKALERRCNLFTTNYDGCFPLIADEILRDGNVDFLLNDGARGFRRRYLQARNFNTYLCETGVFERHQTSIPQINLIHLHGSVYWTKDDSNVVVDYNSQSAANLLTAELQGRLSGFSESLENPAATVATLTPPWFSVEERSAFWDAYRELPIVNPTKWKFHETVFEEHYYQMLRLLSYELEKPNAVLITFGFSFADEHIRNLVKRSLSNPRLQVYICCYSQKARQAMESEFRGFRNVCCVALTDAPLDFSAFNERVFPLDSRQPRHSTSASTANAPVAPPAIGGHEEAVA
jgi:hypothetical protein